MRNLRVDRGDVIVAAGAPADRVLVVREGLVGLRIDRNAAAQSHLVSLVGRGGTFGEGALLEEPDLRSLTAVALAPSQLTEVHVAELDEEDRLVLLPLAVGILASHVRDREAKATYLRSASAAQRVAGCLCDLVHLAPQQRDQRQARLRRDLLTQREIAQYVGCARDAVNKALGSFVRGRWIELSGGHIDVLDLPALHSFSGHVARSERHQPWEQSSIGLEFVDSLLHLVRRRAGSGSSLQTRGAA